MRRADEKKKVFRNARFGNPVALAKLAQRPDWLREALDRGVISAATALRIAAVMSARIQPTEIPEPKKHASNS